MNEAMPFRTRSLMETVPKSEESRVSVSEARMSAMLDLMVRNGTDELDALSEMLKTFTDTGELAWIRRRMSDVRLHRAEVVAKAHGGGWRITTAQACVVALAMPGVVSWFGTLLSDEFGIGFMFVAGAVLLYFAFDKRLVVRRSAYVCCLIVGMIAAGLLHEKASERRSANQVQEYWQRK